MSALPHPGPSPRRELPIALAVVATVFLIQLPVRLCGVSLIDEGAIMQIAEDIRRGLHIYRDAVYPAFPGVVWLTVAAFALGGPSVATTRTLAVALFALATGAAYLIARWSLSRVASFGVVLLFLAYRVWAYPVWQFAGYSTLAVALVLAAACVVGEALERPRPGLVVVAGVLSGGAFLVKQDSGVAGPAALALTLLACGPGGWPGRARAVAALAGGALLVVVPAALGLALSGTLPDLVQHTIRAPLYIWHHFDYPARPALWPPWRQSATIRSNPFAYLPPILFDVHWGALSESALFRDTAVVDAVLRAVYHLPWMVVVVAGGALAVRLARGEAAADVATRREVLLVLLAGVFVLVFNRPQDWAHLVVLYPPTLVLGAVLLGRVVRARRALAVACGVVLVVGAALSAGLALEFVSGHSTPVRSLRGTLLATQAQARSLQGVLDGLAAAAPPEVPLASLPYHPLLNFLSARPGLTRYYAPWPVDPDPDREQKIAADIFSVPGGLVVYSPTQAPHFPRFGEYAPALFRDLATHFAIERSFGGGAGEFTFLLLRRRPPPSGTSLLGAALGDARVTVEPRAGPPRDVAAAERAELAGEALWPFLPVVRVTTLPDAAVSVVYRLQAMAGERFSTRYGINPDRWPDFPPAQARFTVAWRPVDGEEQTLFDAEVDPFREPIDRRWAEVTVDLTPWSGRTIELVLRVTGPAGAAPRPDVAGWGDPRLVPARVSPESPARD